MCLRAEKSAARAAGSSVEKQHQRRRQQRGLHFLLHHGLEQIFRHGAVHNDGRRALLHRPDSPSGTADVKHRQTDEITAALAQLGNLDGEAKTGIEHVLAGQHGALGKISDGEAAAVLEVSDETISITV